MQEATVFWQIQRKSGRNQRPPAPLLLLKTTQVKVEYIHTLVRAFAS
jgi:hypothetical protein